MCQERDSDVVKGVLPYWSKIYCKISVVRRFFFPPSPLMAHTRHHFVCLQEVQLRNNFGVAQAGSRSAYQGGDPTSV